MGSSTPAISGVVETGAYVRDLKQARAFYETVLGFEPMFADDRLCAYPVGPGSVFLLFLQGATVAPVTLAGGTIPPHDGGGPQHYAFGVPSDSLDGWRQRLGEAGVEIESEVTWKAGGSSLYFRDPDDHLVELVTPGLWANY